MKAPGELFRLGAGDAPWKDALARADRDRLGARIWEREPAVWKRDAEHQKIISKALGWLDLPGKMAARADEILEFAAQARARGYGHVVLCGMGGSSLAPEVFSRTFQRSNWPEIIVLDSTCPSEIRSVEKRIDLKRTLFLIASKSGSTLETLSHFEHFFAKVFSASPSYLEAGKHFVAITDPGSPLERLAIDRRFWRIFQNFADIGGRYSALSFFGLVPAALCGADIRKLLARAAAAAKRCAGDVSARENPGLALGAALGTLSAAGRDKLTIVASPEIGSFGAWLEQLVAESTGKEGKGIIPIDGADVSSPDAAGPDRVFIYERLAGLDNAESDRALDVHSAAGNPVVAASWRDRYDLGGRMFVWEFAVAVAGAVLGIDAFDQPNVQESKDNTRAVLDEFEKSGHLPETEPAWSSRGIDFFGHTLGNFFSGARPGRDYVCLQVYAVRNSRTESLVRSLQDQIRRTTSCAVTAGFGPRFLHSTGQLHKGGPDEGLFFQIVDRDGVSVKIPGAVYDFGTFIEAQALGDERALTARGRRFLKARFAGEASAGLAKLSGLVAAASKESE